MSTEACPEPEAKSTTIMNDELEDDIELQNLDGAPNIESECGATNNNNIVPNKTTQNRDPFLSPETATTEFPFDTTTTTNTDSKDDNFLTMYGTGVIGMLERIPLAIKLVAICLFSIAAMIVFVVLTLVYTGEATRMAIGHRETIFYLNRMNDYIIALQDERRFSTQYLTVNQSNPAQVAIAEQSYEQGVSVTRSRRKRVEDRKGILREKIGSTKSKELDPYFHSMKEQDEILDQHRDRVKHRTLNSFDSITFFQSFVDDALLFQTALLDVADLSYRTTEYMFVSRIMEALEKLRAGSTNLLATGGNTDTTMKWVSYRVEYETFERLFLAPKRIASLDEYFAQMNLPPGTLKINLTQAHDLIQTTLLNNGKFVINETNRGGLMLYASELTPRVNILKDVGVSILDSELNKAQDKRAESIGSIVAYCVIAFLFGVLSISSAIILSGTILGPWKRLNHIQEAAIAKFVPKAFLHLLGCKRITDVKLGMHVKKNDLTIMEMEVLNFHTVSQQIKDDEVFDLLNRYLSFVGPVVRKFDGFIQSYEGEKCIALFKNSERAVKASMEIQEMLNMFNADQMLDIKLGTRIHCDSALIGTLGENERIDGVVLNSTYASIKNTLAKITGKLEAKTLATNKVFEHKKMRHKYQSRKIGIVLGEHQQRQGTSRSSIDVYEVLHPEDLSKIAHKRLFSEALTSFLQGRYKDAASLFDRVREQSSEVDMVTET